MKTNKKQHDGNMKQTCYEIKKSYPSVFLVTYEQAAAYHHDKFKKQRCLSLRPFHREHFKKDLKMDAKNKLVGFRPHYMYKEQ